MNNHNILQKICDKIERPSHIYCAYFPYETYRGQHFFYEYDMALKYIVRKCVEEYRIVYKHWFEMLCDKWSERSDKKLAQKLIDISEPKFDEICEIICAHLKEENKPYVLGAYDRFYAVKLVDIE